MAIRATNQEDDNNKRRGASRGGSFSTSGRGASRGESFSPTPKKNVGSLQKKPITMFGQPANIYLSSLKSSSKNSSSRSSNSSRSVEPMSPMSEPIAPAMPTEEDYLKGDATYQATLSALAKQLQSFETDLNAQRSTRKLDYDKSLKDLGYIASPEGAEPTWNWEDPLTASGRSYQNLVNDSASRGTLQSSGYADSLNDLTRALMDQYSGINTSQTQFNTDLDRQATRAKDENTAASQAARAEAIMRRAAQYGFTG